MKQVLYSGRQYIRPNCKNFAVANWFRKFVHPPVDYYEITETEDSALSVGDNIQIIKSVCHLHSLVAPQYPNTSCPSPPPTPPPPILRFPSEPFPTDLRKNVYVAYIHCCLFIFLSLVNEQPTVALSSRFLWQSGDTMSQSFRFWNKLNSPISGKWKLPVDKCVCLKNVWLWAAMIPPSSD